MSDNTTIEWTDATWNIVTGCSVTSPGCANCYAMKLAGTRLRNHPSRKGLTIDSKAGPVWNGQVRFNEEWLRQPLEWKKPRRIFVCAHGDLFHENVPDEWIDKVFAVMALAQQHQFQVLTKRAERMRVYLTDEDLNNRFCAALGNMLDGDWIWQEGKRFRDRIDNLIDLFLGESTDDEGDLTFHADPMPLPNVWLGVSVEDQQRADERIPHLLATPAAIRFISAEPLVGEIDLTSIAWPLDRPRFPETDDLSEARSALHEIEGTKLHWVIAGGESSPDARPMHPNWIRSLRDQCAAADVPFFFKQWGEWFPHKPRAGDDLGGDVRKGRVRIVHPTGEDNVQIFEQTKRNTIPNSTYMARVGKKAAGNFLDGRQHLEFPLSDTPAGVRA